jgi:hypothetical protein
MSESLLPAFRSLSAEARGHEIEMARPSARLVLLCSRPPVNGG